MGKLSVADSWFSRVGLLRGRAATAAKNGATAAAAAVSQPPDRVATIDVLAFEVAGLMSKTVQLWHALADHRVAALREEALRLEGVRKLVSDDDEFLLGLALAEILDALAFLAHAAARLGRRCSDPVLQRLDHVLADLAGAGADLRGFEYAGRKMDRKVKKMEKLVAASGALYQELEVLVELEQGLRRAQVSRQPSLSDLLQRVAWQRQEVKSLRETSLWGRTYDYTVRLLARSLFTIIGRIKLVFGFPQLNDSKSMVNPLPRSNSSVTKPIHTNGVHRFSSGPLLRSTTRSGSIAPHRILPPHAVKRQTKWPVSGSFSGCIAAGGNIPPVLQSSVPIESITNPSSKILPLSLFKSNLKLLTAPPSTLGAAALSLHYANLIIVVEKLVASPHLIGPDARDDLYSMLPTSIKALLRSRLKTYAKNLTSSVYDPVLAAEWSDAITRILEWLSPLAHNMIKWQSERNFEQQHLGPSTNVLLLQTLYFANQSKTEAVITELLVGLNYLWRFGRELNAKAVLECVSSRHYDDYLDSKG